MNALWISRIAGYLHTPESFKTAQKIIIIKTNAQTNLLKRFSVPIKDIALSIYKTKDTCHLLLEEARHAKYFWTHYKTLLPPWIYFSGRVQHGEDIANKLLDIGYHHLANIIKAVCKEKDISTALGFLHIAHESTSQPLVYDLMELFRSDVVDREVLSFLRAKKKEILFLDSKNIAHFVSKIKKRLQSQVYIKEFKQCQTYQYYMDLQIVKLIKAVNHDEVFEPIVLPHRHEDRCRTKTVDIK